MAGGHCSCKESHGFILVAFYVLFEQKKMFDYSCHLMYITVSSSVPATICGIGLKWDSGPIDVLLEDRSVAE